MAVFFSQFIDPGLDVTFQPAIMALTFLLLTYTLESRGAKVAGKVSKLLLSSKFYPLKNKISGSLLMGAATGFALVKRS